MEILLCIAGVAVFWIVIWPAMLVSGSSARDEDDAAALDRLTKL